VEIENPPKRAITVLGAKVLFECSAPFADFDAAMKRAGIGDYFGRSLSSATSRGASSTARRPTSPPR